MDQKGDPASCRPPICVRRWLLLVRQNPECQLPHSQGRSTQDFQAWLEEGAEF